MVALPSMGPDAYVAHVFEVFDVYTFEMWIDEVLEVRGERLTLLKRSLAQNDWDAVESLVIVQYDENIDLVQRWVRFDLEQLDEARAVLDQMYALIEETPPRAQ